MNIIEAITHDETTATSKVISTIGKAVGLRACNQCSLGSSDLFLRLLHRTGCCDTRRDLQSALCSSTSPSLFLSRQLEFGINGSDVLKTANASVGQGSNAYLRLRNEVRTVPNISARSVNVARTNMIRNSPLKSTSVPSDSSRSLVVARSAEVGFIGCRLAMMFSSWILTMYVTILQIV
jgi:hypothetical protein